MFRCECCSIAARIVNLKVVRRAKNPRAFTPRSVNLVRKEEDGRFYYQTSFSSPNYGSCWEDELELDRMYRQQAYD
jgi:hypothetical protein